MKTVLVTGTPGTGKTTLAKKLSLLLDYAYLDVNSMIKKAKIYSSYDHRRASFVVDESELSSFLLKVREKALKEGRKGIVLDSHLSHFLPSKYASLCLVTTCSDLKVLERRLKSRGYPARKVRENLDAEIFDTCRIEALENGHKVAVLDNSMPKSVDLKALAARIRRQSGLSPD